MQFLALAPVLVGLVLAIDPPPPTISGYSGVQLGGAIEAPDNSYMFYTYHSFDGGTDASLCAQDCDNHNRYHRQHPEADCSYRPCVFFNAYVEWLNNVPLGTYCTMYNATWGPDQATNHGQYRGSDHYTISQSYGYSLLNAPTQPAYSSSVKFCDGPFLKDAGFENTDGGYPYLGPWKVTSIGDGGGSAGWNKGHESQFMFGASLFGSDPSPSVNLTQTMNTVTGTHYSYSMWYLFDSDMDVCVINLIFPDGSTNQVSLAGKTWGDWYSMQTTFAGGGQQLLTVNFFCSTGAGGAIFVDDIVIGQLP